MSSGSRIGARTCEQIMLTLLGWCSKKQLNTWRRPVMIPHLQANMSHNVLSQSLHYFDYLWRGSFLLQFISQAQLSEHDWILPNLPGPAPQCCNLWQKPSSRLNGPKFGVDHEIHSQLSVTTSIQKTFKKSGISRFWPCSFFYFIWKPLYHQIFQISWYLSEIHTRTCLWRCMSVMNV